jgi:hypothetical protein
VDTNAANVLINSSLTILFIRMLRNARAPTLRIRLASVSLTSHCYPMCALTVREGVRCTIFCPEHDLVMFPHLVNLTG